jgi:hypothetical protein
MLNQNSGAQDWIPVNDPHNIASLEPGFLSGTTGHNARHLDMKA